MSQTSNNNNRFQLLIPATLAMQVMISDMYSCLSSCYDSCYGLQIIIVMYSCLDFRIICILVLTLLRHLALYHTRLGSVTDSPGFLCPGIGAYGFLCC